MLISRSSIKSEFVNLRINVLPPKLFLVIMIDSPSSLLFLEENISNITGYDHFNKGYDKLETQSKYSKDFNFL